MSSSPPDQRTIRAAWIFPATSPPIPDASITIEGGTIRRLGPVDPAFPADLDLGDVAILPGFVNAHTHLELAPIPWDKTAGPEDEIAWLTRVIQSRADQPAGAAADLIRRNVRAAVEAGTTTIADITTAGQSWHAVAAAPIWGTVFAEILGLSDFRGRQTWQAATDWLNALPPSAHLDPQTRPGLSPHAPYSTAGWLYRDAAGLGLPLTTHLGEMPEERPFLQDRSGPLRQFVERLGAWNEAWRPVGPSPVDYVGSRADWIIAHANIFEPSEFARLAHRRNEPNAWRLAVAYCPRTHARFGHPPHPFRAMLEAGVVVCLGTDSLASSPTLSILDEVRFLHRHQPGLPGETLLRMATIHGAWALRLEQKTGSLEPGKSADLAVLALDGADPGDPHRRWLDDSQPPLATMFAGRFTTELSRGLSG